MAAHRSRRCDARDSGRVLTARAGCSARRIKIGSGICFSRWCNDGGRAGTNGASDSPVDRRRTPRNNWVQPRTGPGFRRWCHRPPRRLPTRPDRPCCIRHKRRGRCLRECSVPVPQAATQASRPRRLSTRCKASRYDPSPCCWDGRDVTANEGNSAAIHGSAFAVSASAANRTHANVLTGYIWPRGVVRASAPTARRKTGGRLRHSTISVSAHLESPA
jgi:hypothetical protein